MEDLDNTALAIVAAETVSTSSTKLARLANKPSDPSISEKFDDVTMLSNGVGKRSAHEGRLVAVVNASAAKGFGMGLLRSKAPPALENMGHKNLPISLTDTAGMISTSLYIKFDARGAHVLTNRTGASSDAEGVSENYPHL